MGLGDGGNGAGVARVMLRKPQPLLDIVRYALVNAAGHFCADEAVRKNGQVQTVLLTGCDRCNDDDVARQRLDFRRSHLDQ